jgi:two-component system chemotaxis response regulator CheY
MPNVLVVDDSRFMRMSIRNMLVKQGYEVIGEAEEDIEAIEKYKELKPDVVTMDIIMPAESGLNAVKHICDYDSDARIIMVSAMGQDSIIEEAISLGARGFVIKPVSSDRLVEAINKALE